MKSGTFLWRKGTCHVAGVLAAAVGAVEERLVSKRFIGYHLYAFASPCLPLAHLRHAIQLPHVVLPGRDAL
ncbi:hypothetical protein E2C01_002284 [Portunus trituberculatus]|uniref:Uncharacterized protein n=1 Tax=Portunus trituberculatus TaxID=210409 RepID=A0A5B7CJI6_PORTR|nr:hypothetical protein [Portunus trituberculatus]